MTMHRVMGLGLVVVAAVPLASLVGGCAPTDVSCEDLATCPHQMPNSDAGSDGQVDGGPGPSDDGADVGTLDTNASADVVRDGSDVEATCNSMLAPNESPCLNEKIALFVSPNGNDQTANAGQKSFAFKTIAAALAAVKAGPKRIYLCDDGRGYSEQLSIDAAADATLDGVALYGGFDCATWSYATTRRTKINAPPIAVVPPSGTPPSSTALAVKGVVGGIKLADIELGVGNSILPGGSSIGVVVDTSTN